VTGGARWRQPARDTGSGQLPSVAARSMPWFAPAYRARRRRHGIGLRNSISFIAYALAKDAVRADSRGRAVDERRAVNLYHDRVQRGGP
jgi:hypothetical protein